ncbi:MAG: HD domain-containing protein [Candidatus Celaenobacter polaris]|nr:HD domain-containing protein [Candidatus Celaenobacter polaris]
MHNKEHFLDNLYKETNLHEEEYFSKYATKNIEAYRKIAEHEKCLRGPFTIDRDRIIYTGAYRRYQGKTQVVYFSNLFDEEMSNRSLHTTYVAQVSRSIGKLLRLNLDLIEAIALGHDLGHPPFGHDGEELLSECCVKHGIGRFHHNIESLFIIDHITNHGKGLNLTFQVRDGIVSHDGEVHDEQLHPKRDKTEKDLEEFIETMKTDDTTSPPATLEACIVRISDTIAYIGQDIEDAIRMGFLNREELPKDAIHKLGSTNDEILSTLITNVIYNSFDKDYVAFDKETSDALYELKCFNYKKIYNHPCIKKEKITIERGMKILFDKYMTDLEKKHTDSKIFNHFLNHKSNQYIKDTNDAEKVRDFIATMTDRYFNQELEDYILPGRASE